MLFRFYGRLLYLIGLQLTQMVKLMDILPKQIMEEFSRIILPLIQVLMPPTWVWKQRFTLNIQASSLLSNLRQIDNGGRFGSKVILKWRFQLLVIVLYCLGNYITGGLIVCCVIFKLFIHISIGNGCADELANKFEKCYLQRICCPEKIPSTITVANFIFRKMLDIKNDFIKKDSRMTWHNNHAQIPATNFRDLWPDQLLIG